MANSGAGRLMITIHTARPTTDWAMGRAILSAFCAPDTRLAPELLSVWSTQHGPFTDIEACAPHWAQSTEARVDGKTSTWTLGMGWRRSHAPQYRAAITNHSGPNAKGIHAQDWLSLHGPFHKGTDWQGLFTRLCDVMGASEGLLTTHLKDGQVEVFPLSAVSRDYAGVGSLIARVIPACHRQLAEAGFGVAVQDTCTVIALMPTLTEARADVPALEARQADLAAILNDGSWTPPKKPSWWDGR